MGKLDLRLHPVKTKIVCMWDGQEGFDFLGMHHRRKTVETKHGRKYQETFQFPSRKAMKKMKAAIKENVNSRRLLKLDMEVLIKNINPKIYSLTNLIAGFRLLAAFYVLALKMYFRILVLDHQTIEPFL